MRKWCLGKLDQVTDQLTNECIVFLTRDRPITAGRNLRILALSDLPIIVIDNSWRSKSRSSIRDLSSLHHFAYHGPREQNTVMRLLSSSGSTLSSFISPLGAPYWNTGLVRNYAILLAKILRLRKVIFIDDDISIVNPELFRNTLRTLDKVDFVGARIGGRVDQSVIGHLGLSQGDPELSEFISGGFMGLRVSSVTEPFLNYYNEDWIWVLMHRLGSYAMIPTKVIHQTPTSLLETATRKAVGQEFGELLLEGVWIIATQRDFGRLIDEATWKLVISERVSWIRSIASTSRQQRDRPGARLATALGRYVMTIPPSLLSAIFKQYFEILPRWRRLLKGSSTIRFPKKMKRSIGIEPSYD